MNLGIFSSLCSLMNLQDSSIFTRLICASYGTNSWINNLGNFIFGLIYNVIKYVLYFMDLLFSYIQKLAGLDMSFNSIEEMITPESDIVFNFLISNKDMITTILKNLLVLVLVLIIVFTIASIIKSQYDAVKNDSEASPVEAIKSMIKAFVLLLVTPLIFIGGIIMSDLVLQTFYRATNINGAASLGTQVFLSSSTSANAYRIYAQNGQRIPIVFDDSKNSEISEYFNENSINDGFVKYLKDSKNYGVDYNPIYATYMTFMTSDFTNYRDINDILYSNTGYGGVEEKKAREFYEKYYDCYVSDDDSSSGAFEDLRKIDSYAEEYYVMADVLDFCIQTGNTLHMETIEQMLDRICVLNDEDLREQVFRQINFEYGIEYYSSYSDGQLGGQIIVENTDDYKDKIKNRSSLIVFRSNYMSSYDEKGEPEIQMQIPIIHVVGETDELLGAKFIITVDKEVKNKDGVIEFYTEPLTNGYVKNINKEFRSDHIQNGSIIVAKGIFKESKYPTAIKSVTSPASKLQLGIFNDVEFYREDIEGQAIGQLSDYVQLSYDTSGGIFKKALKFIKVLLNPNELVPQIDVNLDAMQLTYEKASTPTIVDTLIEGKLRLGYFMKFNATYPTIKSANNFSLAFVELYSAPKMNFLILIMGSFLLLRVSMSALSSLIERAFELFLLFLIYPASCATVPLDGGNSHTSWMKAFTSRIFRTYGFILGINFVFLMFPVIQNIEVFTQVEVGSSKIIRRIGSLFFSVMTVREITNMMNFGVCILLELVAFTLIETIPEVISTIVMGKESALKITENNVFTKIKDTSVKFAKAVGTVVLPPLKTLGYIFSKNKKAKRQQLKNKLIQKSGLTALNDMKSFIPGSGIKKEFDERRNIKQAEQEAKNAEKNLDNVLSDNSSSAADIKKAYFEYQKAASNVHNANTKYYCKTCKKSFSKQKLDSMQLKFDSDNPDDKKNRALSPNLATGLGSDRNKITDGCVKWGTDYYCPNCGNKLQKLEDKKDDSGEKKEENKPKTK